MLPVELPARNAPVVVFTPKIKLASTRAPFLNNHKFLSLQDTRADRTWIFKMLIRSATMILTSFLWGSWIYHYNHLIKRPIWVRVLPKVASQDWHIPSRMLCGSVDWISGPWLVIAQSFRWSTRTNSDRSWSERKRSHLKGFVGTNIVMLTSVHSIYLNSSTFGHGSRSFVLLTHSGFGAVFKLRFTTKCTLYFEIFISKGTKMTWVPVCGAPKPKLLVPLSPL